MHPLAPARNSGIADWLNVNDDSALQALARIAGPRHVLVVEDHAQVREVMGRALRMAGYVTMEAGNGAEARSLLEAVHVDAVVLDVALPDGLDGVQLGKWIRLRHPRIPIVFISGLLEWELSEPLPRDGVTRFLCKPFGARALIEEVRGLLAFRPDVRGVQPAG
jgi:two-component system cell cycle sensor histidine kinase/response regulator CckA